MGRQRRDIPWLDTRDNGVFYAFWYDEKSRQTRRESMETRDAATAQRTFANFLINGPKSSLHVGDAGVTVEQALDWYDVGVPGTLIKGHVETEVVDKPRQRAAIRNLKSYFGKTLMREVSKTVGDDYAAERRAGKHGVGKGGHRADGTVKTNRRTAASDWTIRREMGVLGAAAQWCILHDLMKPDEVPRFKAPGEPEDKAPWLTKDAVRAIFDKAEGNLKAFCRLTYYWGARKTSVESLWVSQIDLAHSRVDLHKPGSKRTKKRRPIVPIYPEIRKDIELLLLDTTTEYLFGQPGNFYEDFVRLCRDEKIVVQDAPAGTVPWPHLLRHSRATHMLMDGEDPYKVAKLLGDNLSTVEKVYGHHTPEYLQTKSNVEVGTNSGT